MDTISQIYQDLRQTEMNDWVGGSDPELVGDACVRVLQNYLRIDASSRLLDFGCGVGRVLLSVLRYHRDVGRITGFDIMPQVIRFCNEHIASKFAKTSFELLSDRNDHYDQFIDAAGHNTAKTHAQLATQYADAFTGIYAFSVFTHVELADFRALLKLLAALTAPGGQVLFTAFLLTPTSRKAIEERSALFPFAEDAQVHGDVFIGNPADPLGFIAFDHALIEQLAFEAGLVINHIEYGSWAGTIPSPNLQDTIVCGKPGARLALRHVPTVARAANPARAAQSAAVAAAVAQSAPSAAPPAQLPGPEATASWPAPQPDMRSLLALEGEAFVRGAYATILGRLADSDGLAHCLAELQKGVTKMTIVSRMRNSVEGKKADRSVQGYERAWLQSRIQWWRSGG